MHPFLLLYIGMAVVVGSILLLRLKKLRLSVKDRLAALRLRSRQPA